MPTSQAAVYTKTEKGFKMPNWEKREFNRRESKRILTENNIAFEEFNDGAHLKIKAWDFVIDFWPGTGLFRHPQGEGRGVFELIAFMKKEEKVQSRHDQGIYKVGILNVDQIFEIAKKSKDKSLYGICTAIHKEIYT